MTVGKIEKGLLECGFAKHRLNCLLITDPMGLLFFFLPFSLSCSVSLYSHTRRVGKISGERGRLKGVRGGGGGID